MSNDAERIERVLSVQILRGDYPPGTRLPTIRALAASFAVNPATAQRAIARLERGGLVRARQGSGTVVMDPEQHGDLSLLPAWLEALSEQPTKAAALLGEFLEVRRVLAARLLVQHRGRLIEHAAELLEGARELLEAEGIEALREADLGFARRLLKLTGNRAAQQVINAAERLLREVPAVAEAMYAEPEQNAAGMQAVMAALADPGCRPETLEAHMAELDARTLTRFEAGLAS